MAYLANKKTVDAIVIHCTASREGVDLHDEGMTVLSALGIDTDRDRKTFNCKAVRQTDLIDK